MLQRTILPALQATAMIRRRDFLRGVVAAGVAVGLGRVLPPASVVSPRPETLADGPEPVRVQGALTEGPVAMFDTDGFHEGTGRFTIPAGMAGTYLLSAVLTGRPIGSKWRSIITRNGAVLSEIVSDGPVHHHQAIFHGEPGDVAVYQNSPDDAQLRGSILRLGVP